MDRLTTNQHVPTSRRKAYKGLALFNIPKRRARTKDNTEYFFPEDLEESFLQGEFSHIQSCNNSSHKPLKPSSVNQRQYHYFADRKHSLYKSHSPLNNKAIFGKSYDRRKLKKDTTAEADQTVPNAEAMCHELEKELCTDNSPFLDELDMKNDVYTEVRKARSNSDSALNTFITPETDKINHEYNGTQCNTVDNVSYVQNKTDKNIMATVVTQNEIPVSQPSKAPLETTNQSFSSMFSKNYDISDVHSREKKSRDLSPWLTSRKNFSKNNCSKASATQLMPRELWCYVNEDYTTDDNEAFVNTNAKETGSLKRNDDEENPFNMAMKARFRNEAETEDASTNKAVSIAEPNQPDPKFSKVKEITALNQDQNSIQNNIEDLSEKDTREISEIPAHFSNFCMAKIETDFHPTSNHCDIHEDSVDYIPPSQMHVAKKALLNEFKMNSVDNKSYHAGEHLLDSDKVLFQNQYSEDSDVITDSQNIQKPFKKYQVSIYQQKKSHIEHVSFEKGIDKDLPYWSSERKVVKAQDKLERQPKSEVFQDKMENAPDGVQMKNQDEKQDGNSALNTDPTVVKPESEDDVIPPSGHSDNTTMLKLIPEICNFLGKREEGTMKK